MRGPSDQIKLMIDSYDDKRSGFEFAVNPDGVQRDFSMSNDTNEDGSWNGVWDVETRIDSLGWTAEFRIPLSQLRFADAAEHTWGFSVWRGIEGYGASSRIHTTRILDMADHLPLVLMLVDEPERLRAFVEGNAELFTTINVALSPLELWQGAAR